MKRGNAKGDIVGGEVDGREEEVGTSDGAPEAVGREEEDGRYDGREEIVGRVDAVGGGVGGDQTGQVGVVGLGHVGT